MRITREEKKKGAKALHTHRKLLPGQFDQIADQRLLVAISTCLEVHTMSLQEKVGCF